MRAAEAGARRIRLQMVTEGRLPGDLSFETRGSLRVLRTEQGQTTAVHSVVEYTFADGLTGRMESVRTPDDGIRILESNPTYGEVYVHIDPARLRDLEWASQVMHQDDFGFTDPRAGSPLGSSMVEDLARRYDLAQLSRRVEHGQDGTWYGGERRSGPGLEGDDPDLPLADRVELFVRTSDQALFQVVFLQAGQPVQRIRVDNLVVGEAMPIESFKIDDKGQKPRDVREHQPMWEQISHLIESAEKESGELAPSKRAKSDQPVQPDKPGKSGQPTEAGK